MSSPPQDVVELAARLLRVPSPSGDEGALAREVVAEMERLGFDDASIDEAGNVAGVVRGRGAAPPIALLTHLDHVDAGDPAAWAHPPFGGEIHDGSLWGRGAVDIKGPLAAQIAAASELAAAPERPPGDVWVASVVQEEIGGLGAAWMAPRLEVPLVVVGEPSRNELRYGHRGRVGLELLWRGRAGHSSAPGRAINPLYSAARFLTDLERLEHPSHPDLGSSSVAPTLVATDPSGPNVIPGELRLTCDWRSVPGQEAEAVRQRLETMARAAAGSGVTVEAAVSRRERRTWTGRTHTVAALRDPFLLPPDHPALAAAGAILAEALGRPSAPGVWSFATDAGHFARAGATVFGFGPGDEALAHTAGERLPTAELEAAVEGYRRLAVELPAAITP